MSTENKIDVAYVAQLARLDIPECQLESLQRDLESIVSHIEQLSEVDVSGVEATAYAGSLTNIWREDSSVQSDEFVRSTLLSNAPALVDEETIKVPQVLPGEGMS